MNQVNHPEPFRTPGPPIPDPLRGEEVGSFAEYTVRARMPKIAQGVLANNDFPGEAAARLGDLLLEMPHGSIRPLTDQNAPDAADWNRYIQPYRGKNWLQAPWFFSETYFYRHILSATGYFLPGPTHNMDPFAYQKREGLESSRGALKVASQLLNRWMAEIPSDEDKIREALDQLLIMNVWGNQADLSMFPAGGAGQPNHYNQETQREHLLIDESQALIDYLLDVERRPMRVDIIADNAGIEMIYDLCLIDFLLGMELAHTATLYIKAHPTFVSDATYDDVMDILDFMESQEDSAPGIQAGRLRKYMNRKKLILEDGPYWTSPLPGWEMPDHMYHALGKAGLIISKGDANYRRLIGDRHWPFTTPFPHILRYSPAPLVALRVLKSELVAGMPPGLSGELAQRDPKWLVNGNWGLIQTAKIVI